jgi:hypothetical protein
MELRDKGLIAVVSLQAVILTAARGVNPDTFWLGRISAQSFMQVVRDLIALLTHRQYGEGPLLAMRLAGDAFQCDSPLPRGIEQPPLFALHHSTCDGHRRIGPGIVGIPTRSILSIRKH